MQKTYKIGEVAKLLDLKTYVLRFWESEFSQIIPLRTEKGQRLYTQKHLDLLTHIKYLLHERGLTLDGAKKELKTSKVTAKKPHKGLQEPDFSSPAEATLHEKHMNQEHNLAAQEHLSRLQLEPTPTPLQPAVPANEPFIHRIIDIPLDTYAKDAGPDQNLHAQNAPQYFTHNAFEKTALTIPANPHLINHVTTELEAIATLLRS